MFDMLYQLYVGSSNSLARKNDSSLYGTYCKIKKNSRQVMVIFSHVVFFSGRISKGSYDSNNCKL